VILNIAGRLVGMVIDSVTDVITLTWPAGAGNGTKLNTDYLIGMGSAIVERMPILIDIDRLMSSAKIGLIETLAA